MPNLVRAKELAKILSVHQSTIWRWNNDGTIPKRIILGPMVSVWDLDAVQHKLLRK